MIQLTLPWLPCTAGRRKSVCPYYSARRAVPEADIILAPYRQAPSRSMSETLQCARVMHCNDRRKAKQRQASQSSLSFLPCFRSCLLVGELWEALQPFPPSPLQWIISPRANWSRSPVSRPCSCLLVKETREALGLRLEGNVVIVDEGHNLGEPAAHAFLECLRVEGNLAIIVDEGGNLGRFAVPLGFGFVQVKLGLNNDWLV